jgi:capsular exopolysaccharide synthesis family protein
MSANFDQDVRGATRYLTALREHWLLISALVLVSVVAAGLYAATATKRYEAEADILVTPISGTDTTFIGVPGLLRESSDQSRAVVTAAKLLTTPENKSAVLGLIGGPATVTVTPLSQSNIVSVTGKASTAQRAARIANTYATVLIAARKQLFQAQLQTQISRLQGAVSAIPSTQQNSPEAYALSQQLGELKGLVGTADPTLQLLSPASPPVVPVWPRPVLSVVVAFIASLLLGVGAAIALELVSPRVNQEEELVMVQRLPILTRVPRLSKRFVRGYLTGREPLPPDLRESYRTLRASLTTSDLGREERFPQVVLVTSALPGEGKTMTSVNLATTLAQAGMRVLLVDGDLRRPMVATVFGVTSRSNGFADLLAGRVAPEDACVRAPGQGDRLRLLLASPEHGMLVDLLEPSRVQRVLAQLRLFADVVVIDSPPLTEVSDALTLADEADAVVVAVRLGRTRRDRLNELRRMLARRGVSPAGFVVTQRRRQRRSGYYYGTGGVQDVAQLPAAVADPDGNGHEESRAPEVILRDLPRKRAAGAPRRAAR